MRQIIGLLAFADSSSV